MRSLITVVLLSAACRPAPDESGTATRADTALSARITPRISANDNRRPAGWLKDGVLTVRLEARNGMWYPEGPTGAGLPVAAFGEAGKAPENPGPLIRVPAGTVVRVSVRNALAKPLTVLGLGEQRGIGPDSIGLAPGAERTVTFVATTPGIWYYTGSTTPAPVLGRGTEDSQLQGAIVVDPPGTIRPPPDRIFLVSWWFTTDPASTSGLGGATLAINGRSWPHTEGIDALQGDSLRWRWINLTGVDHPMHLHGFYFRVDGKGDGASYAGYPPAERRRAETEVLPAGGTMALAWSPDRVGDWIFQCHFVGHVSHLVRLGGDHTGATAAGSTAMHQMAGLVTVRVR